MVHYGKQSLVFAVILAIASAAGAQAQDGNRPDRLAWFEDLGFGMFIHWSVDSQLGSVISHSLVGASDDYVERYIEELPPDFNPKQFEPAEWARLARLAGMSYVVFTTKHHSGFTMFETATTDFGIMQTPFGRDVTSEVVDAFREEGLAIGFYFSPDDFVFLHRQGTLISRRRPEAQPINNPELMAHNKAQLRELLTNYGPIDVLFIDGPPEGLTELAWELQPDIVITRGAMETPEQTLPGEPIPGPWEACFTMGTQWQYKPTNEDYKSGTRLIEMLVETRAKGGNLLLNVGPEPDGTLPPEQEGRLREVALWNFVNGEAVEDVRPWVVTNEDNIWFTQSDEGNSVYAIVTGIDWEWGNERSFALRSVEAGENTRVSVLGQNDRVLEYQPDVTPRTIWRQGSDGLHVTATRAQRLYNDREWPNPVVLKLENVVPAEVYQDRQP